MAQENEVMAFRKRLKSAGYTEIRIFLAKDPANRSRNWLYDISAVEPLAGKRVFVTLTVEQMYHAFQRQRGGIRSGAYSKSGAGIPSNRYPALKVGIPASK